MNPNPPANFLFRVKRKLGRFCHWLGNLLDLQPRVVAEDRYVYQQRLFGDFSIRPGDKVVDIGSGGDPFPHATVLVDLYEGKTHHRAAPIVKDGREFVVADILHLPFTDRQFDFAYCSHVMEHVDDPLQACREVMRIAKRGYIETPTLMKDELFCWADGMHKWHLVSIANRLCFFEYDPRRLAGIRSSIYRELIFSKSWHPLQDSFIENQDVFNVMFPWENTFEVSVFWRDGRVEHSTSANS